MNTFIEYIRLILEYITRFMEFKLNIEVGDLILLITLVYGLISIGGKLIVKGRIKQN